MTGGCGFIGSNLVDMLVDENEVFVVDNLDTGKKEYCNPKAKYIFNDIRELFPNNVPEELENVEIIFHLAALARIQPSFSNPLETIDINALGTGMLCEYARHINARLIYSGSSTFYGGVYLNPYALAKWEGEEICKMYSKVYSVSTAIARFFNVYGPRHPSREGTSGTVVGIFENKFLSGEPLTLVGTGEQRRDFTHIYDICRGLIAISKDEHFGKVFNLGSGTNCSIKELAEMFPETEKVFLPPRPGETDETLADISETTDLLEWKPVHNLESYVKKWIEENES